MQVTLSQLTRSFPGPTPAGLFDVSLEVASGELLTVVGPSGAGKSTLLRLIAGLEEPERGSIHSGERDATRLPPHERNVGLLAQRPALYSHLSVKRNLSIGLEMWQSRRRDKLLAVEELNRRVVEAIQLLEL